MVKISKFSVEAWMDKYENDCKYNIAETCCASVSIDQLRDLSEDKTREIIQTSTALTYGAIRGSDALRDNLSHLYSARSGKVLPRENILTTNGAIQANYLVAYALLGPGDHVICHYPTYQSLFEIPKQLGAEVSFWKASPSDNWLPSIDDLKSLIKPNTKMLIINNPHNPTGAIFGESFLQQVAHVAAEHNIIIHSDEVYRPIFHGITPMDADFPSSIISSGYNRVIATGSLSKAYSLAGIRVGWIASRDPSIIAEIAEARHYTLISVSSLDEQVAAYALSQGTVHRLLARNIALAKTNVLLLEKFVLKNDDACDWVKPVAGTTAFVRFHRDGKPVDSVDFCEKLLKETGVLFVPGSECFGEEFKGYVRIGFVNHTEGVKEGLDKATRFIRKNLDDVKLAE